MNPANEWPTNGKLEFHKVQLRYRTELPPVLNNITFVINAGEHIGKSGFKKYFRSYLRSMIR